MNHLESLISQFYEWKGYIVKTNIHVGRLRHGGWEGELDVVAYHPETDHLIHLEPSTDADPWAKREVRFGKKFRAGRKYIKKDVFPWLAKSTVGPEQVAVLVASTKNHTTVGGGAIISLDQFVATIKSDIAQIGVMRSAAIPEKYSLLRTIQLVVCGYDRLLEA